ncbi:hypothetical protein HRbin11_01908 [bacterium HR11]|nr:hypothetical protein HRbin11_01908 [bacterium HR11]
MNPRSIDRRIQVSTGAFRTGPFVFIGTLLMLTMGVQPARAAQWGELFVRVEPPLQDVTVRVRPMEPDGPILTAPTLLEAGTWYVPLPAGRYRVEVLYLDRPVESREVLARPNERATVVVRIPQQLIPQAAGTVEVRAPRGPEQLQSPATAYVLSSTLTGDVAVSRRWQLQDLLAETSPGVVRSHNDIAHVRGAETAIGYNINGTTALWTMNPVFGLGPDPSVFRWIQLRTGGYAAEYGWRFMGVMDAVPQSGLGVRGTTGQVEAGGGSPGTWLGRVALGAGGDRWGLYTNLSGLQSDEYFQPRALEVAHDRGRALRLFVRGDYRWSDRWLSALTLMFNGGRFQIPFDPAAPERLEQESRLTEVSGLFETDYVGGRWQVSIRTGWSLQTQRLEALHDGQHLWGRGRRRDGVGHLDVVVGYTWRPEWTLRGGVQLRRLTWDESLDARAAHAAAHAHPARAFLRPADLAGLHAVVQGPGVSLPSMWSARDDGWLAGLFVEQHWALARWVRGNVGLRWDRVQALESASYVSPRLNVTLGPPDGPYSVLLSYGRLVWSPPIENYLLSSVTHDSTPVRSLVADVWEVGFRWTREAWTFQTAGFYRYGRNVYHTVNELTVGDFPLEWFPYVNFRAERVRGFETQARFESRSVPVSFILNYTLAWHDFYGPVTGGFGARSEMSPFEAGKFPAPMDQRHTVTGIVTAAPWPWLRASLSGTWASGLPVHEHAEAGHEDHEAPHAMAMSPAADRMPSYLYLNGQVAVRFRSNPDVWLTLGGENLTNRRVPITVATAFNPAQYLPERKVLLTLRAAW